jgi:hypothetical protein
MEVGQQDAPLRVAECLEALTRRLGLIEVSFDAPAERFAVRAPRYIWRSAGEEFPVSAQDSDLLGAATTLHDRCREHRPVPLPSGVTQWVIRPTRT